MPADRNMGELSLLGRLGAYTQQAANDTRDTTKAARAARDEQFVDQVDPERTLPAKERARRVEAARKAHFTRLSLLSSRARRAKKSTAQLPDETCGQS